jgi:ABC-type cobalamin/Fe3+-siderophores transport system ATPase subunit
VQPPNNDIGSKIAPQIRNLIYRFSSERSVRARSPHGYGTTLAPNAANLPEVLNALQANAAAFEEFNRLVSEVLPQIRWVSVRPVSEGYEIVVWSIEKATKRDDLAVPLDQTGSGVGQVLAILYVLVTAYEPKAIIIDEPQSFLHPSSAIKLVSILNRHPQHQFILATHSPSIIAAASPKNILALTYQDAETRLEVFDLHKAASFKSFLDAAGLEFQDLFGADNILWVEGPTEEHAFPEIIDALTNIRMMGTVIRPVSATGDLEGQDAERVFKIYRTLTHGNAILPPALAFVLDSESRSAQGLLELTKQSQERAVFLPRRMFENYLLRVEAIAAIANSIPDFTAQPINPKDVSDKIDEKKTQKAYFAPLPVSSDWAQKINASKLLKDIFGELSDHRVEYRKPDHSVRITRWLLQNHPEDLREIADVLQQAFAKSPALGTVSST